MSGAGRLFVLCLLYNFSGLPLISSPAQVIFFPDDHGDDDEV